MDSDKVVDEYVESSPHTAVDVNAARQAEIEARQETIWHTLKSNKRIVAIGLYSIKAISS